MRGNPYGNIRPSPLFITKETAEENALIYLMLLVSLQMYKVNAGR